jgi:hypothetical protein
VGVKKDVWNSEHATREGVSRTWALNRFTFSGLLNDTKLLRKSVQLIGADINEKSRRDKLHAPLRLFASYCFCVTHEMIGVYRYPIQHNQVFNRDLTVGVSFV